MISENQELIKANNRVESLTQKIAFRDKGRRGKYIAELTKATAERDRILSDIKREGVVEETEAFIKDYYENERIRKEKDELVKEIENASALFKKYKGNPIISIPIKIQKEKPSFSEIGDKIRRENQEALRKAQIEFDSAQKKSSGRSPAYRGKFAGQLQVARNRLNLILKDIEHESILIDFYELRAEIAWNETVIAEREAEIKERQSVLDEHAKNFALMEKHGFIKPKT